MKIIIFNEKINSARGSNLTYEAFCTIWYHLYNLKNVKNTHGG